jgi:hypothetical protein
MGGMEIDVLRANDEAESSMVTAKMASELQNG